MNEQVSVSKNAELKRYEIRVGHDLAGFADYMLHDGLITFTHTEVEPFYEGRGLGSRLVRFALDDVREAGERKVLPVCPFVKSWMAKHPEYADLRYGH